MTTNLFNLSCRFVDIRGAIVTLRHEGRKWNMQGLEKHTHYAFIPETDAHFITPVKTLHNTLINDVKILCQALQLIVLVGFGVVD